MEAKYLLFVLFAMGGLAVWAGSEAVMPAYMIGMVLAGTVGKDHVSHSPPAHLDLWTADALLFHTRRIVRFRAGIGCRSAGLRGSVLRQDVLEDRWPAAHGKAFKYQREEGLYYTLMMSTGLTFGTISSLFGLSHDIITETQYSFLVATVIGSAVIPTIIANAFFMPRHLLPKPEKTP